MSVGFAKSDAEEAALGWLGTLGYTIRHGPEIAFGVDGGERSDPGYHDTILQNRLHRALTRLNPGLPAAAVFDAYRKLLLVEAPNLLARNRALHRMLVDGVNVEYTRSDGSIAGAQAKVIDFDRPEQNDWLAVNQFTVIEGQESRRADTVIFVNGLPLGVIELKNPADENATLWDAVQQLENYQNLVPALFTYNAALIASDGVQARIGALGAGKEWFKPWRTISGREDAAPGLPELQVVLAGAFQPRRFLDVVRHFIVFEDFGGGALAKKIAGYHQFHAVNVAVEETLRAANLAPEAEEAAGTYFARRAPGGEPRDKRVGVVWHTQGSGKSLTMAFYAGRLILHPAMENPTIVVITELLERSIRRYQNRAIETAQVIEELIALARDMRAANARGEELGLSEDELAIYDALETNDSAVKVLGEPTLKTIARELVATVRKNVTIDWTLRENVHAQMRVIVRRILRKYGYPPDKQEKATQTVLEQAALFSEAWATGI